MKKLLSLYLITIMFSFSLKAQEDNGEDPFINYRHAISVLPQYAAISGIRVDYERKLKSGAGANWLLFAPQFYSDQNGYDAFDKMSGVGMNVYFKRYLSHSQEKKENLVPRTNIYFSAGPTFQYYNMRSVEEVPEQYEEDGVTYIRFNSEEVPTKIYKVGINSDFGLQFIFNQFMLDLYGGVGFRLALDKNGETFDYFNDYWTDFGYSGILMTGGIRFGFLMK